MRLVLFAVTGKQEKSAGEPFLARIEQLIDQVSLDSDVPGQHELDEQVGEVMLRVKHLEHFIPLNDEYGGRSNRRRRPHANGLPCQTAFTKKISRSQNGDDCFLADFIDHGELHTTAL